MQQQLHLLIVNPSRRTALAARYGARWLLPSIACDERARSGPSVARWCAERGIGTGVAGQWLGRMGPRAIDWLVAIPSRDAAAPAGTSLEWMPLDALAGGRSVLDYQTWALARSLERESVPGVAGPFGALDWPERVRAWMTNTVGLPPSAWTSYRTSAHEVVLGIETPRGRVYFKGLAGDRAMEATLTERLAAVTPESFARSIALERRDDGSTWWVSEACAGTGGGDAAVVAGALGRLQQRLHSRALYPAVLENADLTAALQWAGEEDRSVDTAFPESWIPMDVDPTNVLIDNGRVRFIDLDDSFAGPAPLAMAAFAVRCGGARAPAYRAYEQSWPAWPARFDWRRVEAIAMVFQAWRGWLRVRSHVARGELHADLDAIEHRIRARLSRSLQRG